MQVRASSIALGFVLSLAASACGGNSDGQGESGGAHTDAGDGAAHVHDAGVAAARDAAADAGVTRDAGTHDAGAADAAVAEAGDHAAVDAGGSALAVDPGEPRDAVNVFLSGHSAINLVMPAMFEQIALGLGQEHRYNLQIGSGATLRVRYMDQGMFQQRDGKPVSFSVRQEIPNARTIGTDRRYDTLIVTEAVPVMEQVVYNDSVGYTARFHALLMQSDPQGTVYLFDTWERVCATMSGCAESDFPGWIQGTRDRYVIWECIASMANRAPEAEGPEVRLLPAGIALARAADEILNGTVPGVSSPKELFSDFIHESDLGNYYIALVLYSAVYHRDPASAPTEFTTPLGAKRGFVGADTAARLQELAHEVVAEFYADEASHLRTPEECRDQVAAFCQDANCAQRIDAVFAE
jgi:hypothetical protein